MRSHGSTGKSRRLSHACDSGFRGTGSPVRDPGQVASRPRVSPKLRRLPSRGPFGGRQGTDCAGFSRHSGRGSGTGSPLQIAAVAPKCRKNATNPSVHPSRAIGATQICSKKCGETGFRTTGTWIHGIWSRSPRFYSNLSSFRMHEISDADAIHRGKRLRLRNRRRGPQVNCDQQLRSGVSIQDAR